MIGEGLICREIDKLNKRVDDLKRAQNEGRIGERTFRARSRFIRKDFEKLAVLARRYGFNVAL